MKSPTFQHDVQNIAREASAAPAATFKRASGKRQQAEQMEMGNDEGRLLQLSGSLSQKLGHRDPAVSPEIVREKKTVEAAGRSRRKSGNWLNRNQAQELVNATSNTDLRGWRDGAGKRSQEEKCVTTARLSRRPRKMNPESRSSNLQLRAGNPP